MVSPIYFDVMQGLVVWAAYLIKEVCWGNCCGQVLMWEPEDFFWEEIEEMTTGIACRYKAAYILC